MATTEDTFKRLIREAELMRAEAREAYQKGWNDAMAALNQFLNERTEEATGSRQIARQDTSAPARRGVVPTLVRKIISDEPGLTGVEIVRRAQETEECSETKERSIRTALRRLRLDGTIIQRDGRWYLAGSASASGARLMQASARAETAGTADQADPAAPKPDNQGGV